MSKNQILIQDHKEIIPLTIEQTSVYLRSKIIEAYNEEQEAYYLFFYKDNFLTALKATRLKLNSFIEDSFKKGIVFHTPHPIIEKLIQTNHPYKAISLNQLIRKLQNQYQPQETAFILTFFESFFSKKVLFTHIQEIYYEFRRNGQMFSCYQVLRTLLDFAPNNRWVKQLAGDINFSKYGNLYLKYSEELLQRDRIFAEKWLFAKRNKTQYFNLLEVTLKKDESFIDVFSLYMDRFLTTGNLDSYEALQDQFRLSFDEEEICQILANLSLQLPQFHKLQEDYLEQLLKLNKLEEATQLMTEHKLTPTSLSPRIYKTLIEKIESEPTSLHYEKLNTLLIPLAQSNPVKAEKILQRCISLLFKKYDIQYIKDWIAPIKEKQPSLAIYSKLEKIEQLRDDPDKQLVLGELYFELMQYDRAIDCFSWEMELNETNPKPVEWLAKIYHEIGMEQEYQAYQQLLEKGTWL